MICIQGEKVCLKTFTRDEYHEFCKMYIADSIMDPNPYVYDKKTEDKEFDAIIYMHDRWEDKLNYMLLNPQYAYTYKTGK